MSAKLFEAALGMVEPWYVRGADFDAARKTLTIGVDFIAGSRFAVPGVEGAHPAHDTVTKRYRHLNFFQHECYLEVRMPRVRLPDGGIRLVEPDWAGKLAGFTLMFEALIIMLCREMPFAAVARIVGGSWYLVHAVCALYVELAVAEADLFELRAVAIDETSCRCGHEYPMIVADAEARAWAYREQLRDILDRRQINVVSAMFAQWATGVMRSKWADEGGRPAHPQPHGGHRRPDADAPDRRLPGSLERAKVFYQRVGFDVSPIDPMLLMATLADLQEAAG